jgi:uncharacterized damage-inducible protein DinB
MSIPEEPWLRGPIPGLTLDIAPFIAPLLYSFQMAREDLAHHTADLTTEQIWLTPNGFGSVGFHLRHIAGATDRLMTYATGAQLSAAQLSVLNAEKDPGATREILLAAIDLAFAKAESTARALDPAHLTAPRTVGRKQLPTTVIGLLIHTAEHAQRHVGQAISAAKLARWLAEPRPTPGAGPSTSTPPAAEPA